MSLRRHEFVHLPLPGHSVQEAGGSRDGAGAEESGHAVHHRQQQHDQSPLPTGTLSSRLKPTTFLLTAQPVIFLPLRVRADLPQVPAGLPPGAEAEGPPELCDVAAPVRARHWPGVGAGDAGIHLSDLPRGE